MPTCVDIEQTESEEREREKEDQTRLGGERATEGDWRVWTYKE